VSCALVILSLTHAFAPTSLRHGRFTLSMNNKEQTYIMIKPDGVQRCVIGNIVDRFEKKGYLLKGMKLYVKYDEMKFGD